MDFSMVEDYAALKDRKHLIAIYRRAKKDDALLALSMRSQYAQFLGPVAKLPEAAVPSVTPRTLSALTTHVRQTWRTDAVPVLVDMTYQGGALREYILTVDYYSPSTRSGLEVVHGSNGVTLLPAAHPHWGTVAIPGNFVPLNAIVAYAHKEGVLQGLDHSVLYRTSNTPDPTDLMWNAAFGKNDPTVVDIQADIMSKAEFNRLVLSADDGDRSAQYQLALVYETGVAGPVDAAKSILWLNRAVAKGSHRAENKLGQFYQSGFGVKVDPGAAAYWYLKAASAGYGPAQFNLALLYETGLGVSQSWIEAQNWLVLAARQGMQNAYAELAIVRAPARRQANEEKLVAEQRAEAAGCRPLWIWSSIWQRCVMSPGLLTISANGY
jgi:TPR repeat protein